MLNQRYVIGAGGTLHDATLMPWSEPRAEKRLTVLVACKEPRTPLGLEHIGEWRIFHDTSTPWAQAANQLLDTAARFEDDALFLDDDVTLTAGCLDHVFSHYDHADLFGLDLHALDGSRQVGARHAWDGTQLHDWVQPGPAYVAHVSTSAIYIKAGAIAAGLRFPVWPGIHWEDVAFCFDAWARGLRVMAVPGLVLHAIEGGVGATKRHSPSFWERWGQNRECFQQWCEGRDLGAVPREAMGV